MPKADMLKLLRDAGLKCTHQRIQILSLLLEGDVHLTADQTFFALKAKGETFGLATVYRTLSVLEENGILAKVEIDGRQSFYFAHGSHRHQLLCTGCGKIVLLDRCPAEQMLRSIEKDYGFLVTGHSFEIFGLCPECRKKMEEQDVSGKTL